MAVLGTTKLLAPTYGKSRSGCFAGARYCSNHETHTCSSGARARWASINSAVIQPMKLSRRPLPQVMLSATNHTVDDRSEQQRAYYAEYAEQLVEGVIERGVQPFLCDIQTSEIVPGVLAQARQRLLSEAF